MGDPSRRWRISREVKDGRLGKTSRREFRADEVDRVNMKRQIRVTHFDTHDFSHEPKSRPCDRPSQRALRAPETNDEIGRLQIEPKRRFYHFYPQFQKVLRSTDHGQALRDAHQM